MKRKIIVEFTEEEVHNALVDAALRNNKLKADECYGNVDVIVDVAIDRFKPEGSQITGLKALVTILENDDNE